MVIQDVSTEYMKVNLCEGCFLSSTTNCSHSFQIYGEQEWRCDIVDEHDLLKIFEFFFLVIFEWRLLNVTNF